jgi:aminopeptidase N
VADVRLHPDAGRIEVAAKLALAHGGVEARKDVLLLLAAGLEVERASFDGAGVATERDGAVLRVKLPKEWPPATEATLEIRYAGPGSPDGAPLRLEADGGYGIGAGGWLPSGAIGDLFTYEATFRAPAGYEVVASGAQRPAPPAAAGEAAFAFASDLPLFGVYFAYGRFATVRGEWRGRPISVHAITKGFDRGQAFIDEARAILDLYAERFGDIPWPKLAIVEADLPPILAGTGPASMLLLERKSFAPGGAPPRNLMAHELAHQWWGNLVPPTLAPGYAPWLSEGLATYADALYLEERDGAAAAREHLTKYAHLYYEIVLHVPDEPLDDAWMTSPAYRAIAYEKAARTVHMLRYALGDEAFFRGLRDYAAANRFQDSTTDSLRLALEKASGRDLAGFFADWMKRPGVPSLAIAGVRAQPAAGGEFSVECEVKEEGTLFRVPAIELRFEAADGRTEARRIALTQADETFRFELPFAPERAVLDPGDDILKRPTPATEWPGAAPTVPAGAEARGGS